MFKVYRLMLHLCTTNCLNQTPPAPLSKLFMKYHLENTESDGWSDGGTDRPTSSPLYTHSNCVCGGIITGRHTVDELSTCLVTVLFF